MTTHIAAEPPTYDKVQGENGSIVVAAKAYAVAVAKVETLAAFRGSIWEALPSEVAEAHEVLVVKAGALANLLADRLAAPEDGMHTVHAGNYFAFLMEDQ